MRPLALVVLFGCVGPPPATAKTVELGAATNARTGRASPVMVFVQKGIARHAGAVASMDLAGTAYANDVVVFDALRKETDVEIPAMVLESLGLRVEAAERRLGREAALVLVREPEGAHVERGLGATVDERYQTATHLFLGARSAIVVMDRALKIDAPWGERKHPSFFNWNRPSFRRSRRCPSTSSRSRAIGESPKISNAWRTAWKEIVAMPKGPKPMQDAADGEAMAASFLAFLGRLVPQAEYDAAGKQMTAFKSPDAHAVMFRIADLTARSVLPIVMEQMEDADSAKELRALDPIRSRDALVAARAAVDRAVTKAKSASDRTQALCTVIGPTLAEASPDALPEDVERYLAVLDAAFVVGVPGLDAATLAFFEKLVTLARGSR